MTNSISLRYWTKKSVEYFLYFIIIFQETSSLEDLYTLNIGVNITPVDIMALISIGLLLVNSIFSKGIHPRKLDYYLALSFPIITLLIGSVFYLTGPNVISVTSYIRDAHYYVYIMIYAAFCYFSKSELTKIFQNIVKIYALYIIIFLIIYIIDRTLVTEYSFRVTSRTDLLIVFLLPVLDHKSLESVKYKGFIKILFLMKLILSFSRGLFFLLGFLYLLKTLSMRLSITTIMKGLTVIVAILYGMQTLAPELFAFFGARFTELVANGQFSLLNTNSFQAKISDVDLMTDKMSFIGNGLGATILIDKGWAGFVEALYSDSLYHTLIFKFGTIFGSMILCWYMVIIFYKDNKFAINTYSILTLTLFLANASMIYWRTALMVLFIVFVVKTLNNSDLREV